MIMHDEQRLMTLVGGPLNGHVEAWEAGQDRREITRWQYFYHVPLPPREYVYGTYLEGSVAGIADWHGPPPLKPKPKPKPGSFWVRLFCGPARD